MAVRADPSQRLVALFGPGALLLLTCPSIFLFDHGAAVAGVPLLYAGLFGAWAALIAWPALAVPKVPDLPGRHERR